MKKVKNAHGYPGTGFYRRLWRNHRLHHFQNENYWFGLTMLTGDRLLETQPPKEKASRSKTVLNLGVETSPEVTQEQKS